MTALPVQQDFSAVAEWMDGEGLGTGPIQDVRPLTGGTQNIMLGFERAGRRYVLRRGPQHLRPRSNDVLRRECGCSRRWPPHLSPMPA